MNITIIGSGYVGLVSGVCFADIGHNVTCIDKDQGKIETLNSGEIPIFEPGLKELLAKNVTAGRISFSTDLGESLAQCDAIFIAVGTPQDEDGSADMSYVLAASKEINELCGQIGKKDLAIVTKSTVPVGTADKIREIIGEEIKIASNPEFLREGNAIDDFMNPDRIVIGCDDELSDTILSKIYESFGTEKLVKTTTKTSELIKYTSNAFLATKIAFINEIADLCEKTGANIEELARATGLDSRIGEKFLNAGPGFGGSCFPKDVSAIINIADKAETNLSIVRTVEYSNEERKASMARRVIAHLDEIGGKNVAVLGLAFKANTDDIRSAASTVIGPLLSKQGAEIIRYDPAVGAEIVEHVPTMEVAKSIDEALTGADAAVVLTEWAEIGAVDWSTKSELMRRRVVVDLRNLYNPARMAAIGFNYMSLGRQEVQPDF